jgi:class 3 adenylate cyclase
VVNRGTATVVFTDLVGSTALRSRLGEDAADDLRRRHDDVLSAVTARLAGTVVKSMGDGLMATFGSAADGLEAAVGFQQAVAQLAEEIDPAIALRVGVSVGDVAWEDGDCFGLPVVEAARLEASAASGQILCSAVVKLMSGGRAGVEFESVGELELKGLEAPVEAFAVSWVPLPAAVAAPRDPFAARVESSNRFSGADDRPRARGRVAVASPQRWPSGVA